MQTQRFYAGLNGLRLLSAYAVVSTHISYQTGHINNTLGDYFFGRLDIAVAVFFSLSGFLLWQDTAYRTYHCPHNNTNKHLIFRYYIHRCARILPSYWAVVLIVLLTLPSQLHASWKIRIANIALAQNYIHYGLVEGLTQMWSLDVEVTFYLILPIIWIAIAKIHRYVYRQTIFAISFFLSLAWWAIPIHAPHGSCDIHSLLPGYWCWFVPGIILAEYHAYLGVYIPKHIKLASNTVATRKDLPSTRGKRLLSSRWLMYSIAIISYLIIASPLGGPLGLHDPNLQQRIVRTFFGAIVAAALLAPQIIAPKNPKTIFSLSHPLISGCGKWGYGIFLWHLYIVAALFSILKIFYFQGYFIELTFFSLILVTLIGAANYILIEAPYFTLITRYYDTKIAHKITRDPLTVV